MSAVPFSYRQYAGNGSTTSFSVPFPYLLKSHVKVYIGFNILDGTYSSELADGTGFTWSSGTQIQCTTAPVSGQTLTVIRVTPNTTRLVDWQDGSNLISNDLDTADLQNLYVIQEQQDRNDAGITQSTAAQTAATAATAASNTATTTANTALSTANTALSTANTASSNASAAVTTANTASTNASAAVATANTASTNASAAVATANTASTSASSAVTTANSAVTTANSAVTTANSAVTTANNANTTAQAANTTATNAESIANSALSIVAGTVQFVPVADLAAIPASPSNDDAIQVQDSTGIQSFTPLTGLPAGFLGTPQLFVRLQYDTPGSTWQYVGYGANDPDNRYVVQGITGTANNPSFYFDPDTGIYSPGANELGLSTGGAARLTIDSAGNVAIPGTLGVTGAITGSLTGAASLNVLKAGDTMTGNLTAPAFIPNGSTAPTNGLYLPAANSVALSTNGTGRLFVDASGNVEIAGTGKRILGDFANATLANRLSFQSSGANLSTVVQAIPNGTATSGQFRVFNSSDPDNAGGARLIVSTTAIGLESVTSGTGTHLPINFSTGGSARLTILTDGKVGIGGTPSTDLHITSGSGARVRAGGATGSGFEFNDANTRLDIPAANIIAAYTNNTERARIDSSGRLLVGTSSDIGNSSKVQIKDGNLNIYHADSAENAGYGIHFSTDGGATARSKARIFLLQTAANGGTLTFSTTADGASSPTERMRITSNPLSSVLIGQTGNPATSTVVIQVQTGSANGVNAQITSNTGTSYPWANYNASGTYVGGITCTSTATSFPTSSDYRLKTNVQPLAGAINLVSQLKPSTFEFNENPGETVQGFIAHELQEVVPLAVIGEKDAEDANGNPVYQGVDAAKLVPLLTAALQEAIGEIESLKARVAAAGI